ncbi:hypothetical protein [Umezawaea sp.]|uniref:hypothetical protein n=1 Tax=Umezawaea sp. TaxID=1955258 RepID=UPI002ED470D6
MAETATEEKKDGGIPGLTLTPGFGEGTEWVDGFSGAGMVDTVAGLVKAIQDGNTAAMAAYGVGLGFDVVGAVLNPLGALLGAGVGWLIDHLYFLREPLDLLMGDNIAVRQETEKIKNDADKYQALATTHVEALKKLDPWTGQTADAFKASMKKVADELAAIGMAINGSAETMATMGACVTAFRSLVRDIIAMVIGNLIGGALVAAGLAPFTFGASIVAFVGVAVATALEALGRILRHITNLKSLLTANKAAGDQLGTALTKIADDAGRLNRSGGTTTPSGAPPVAPPASKPPEVPGGGAPAPKPPDTPPAPPVSKPPEVPGGGAPAPKPPDTPPAPPVSKPPEVPGGGAPAPKPPDTTVPAGAPPVSKPPEVPGGAPKPPGGTTTPSGAPPVSKPPEVPGAPAPKPPDPKPPTPPVNQPPKWSLQDIKDIANKIKNGRKDGMEQFGKFGKGKLEAKLTGPPHNKTPQEAADIARWVKNFEELAAPGGTVNVGGRVVATGTLLHLAHELWKEMSADVQSQKENEDYMQDIRDYNKTK